MTFAYLDDQTLRNVRRAAIELGFADDNRLPALNEGISRRFVASYTRGGNAQDKLITLTGRMNETKALVSGEVPLAKWLNNAISMAGDAPEELVFRKALEQMSVGVGVGTARQALDATALPVEDGGGLEIQIGEDDTLGAGFLHDGSTASRSVAKLLVHRHFSGIPSMLAGDEPEFGNGTGWILAPRLLITNFHVINARMPWDGLASPEDFERQGAATQVIFDFYKASSEVQATPSAGCVASDRALDYALLRLSGEAAQRPPLRLRANHITKPKERALRERVNVLQHPNGGPMRLGFRDNFVVAGSEERLSYLTDTAGGAWGSPICDDKWFVAALHRGFSTIDGEPLRLRGKVIRQENYGTPIGQILAHLAARRPDLRAEVDAGQAAFETADRRQRRH